MLQRVCSLLRMRPPVLLNRGTLFASGDTVPTDDTDGYQTGCIFQHTGATGTSRTVYLNEGTVTACAFKAIEAGDFGDFASLEAGSGVALSSSDTSNLAVYGDDNELSIASSVYNLRTRLLLTVDQDGASLRALMAQLKLCDGVDVSTGIYTASQGYVELAGDTSVEIDAVLSCFDASLEIGAGNTLTVDAEGEVAGIHIETTGTGTIAATGICAGVLIDKAAGAPDWPIGIKVNDSEVAIIVANDLVDTLTGGLLRYGTSASAISYTPVSTGSHSAFQMYITSEDCIGGLGMVGVRVRLELTGTSNATINAGQFWAKINCTDYTGHYLGGHPTGVSGIIECVGTARTAASVYAVMAGVCGEVRPISGTVNAGGVICGVHAKIFGTGAQVAVGDVVGVFVQAIGGAASDIGILVGTHTGGAAWTTGIKVDSTYGTITTGIDIGTCATAAINITSANLNCIKSVFNIGAQLGQYVQGIKMEHTRSGDIQPSTGGWWGAQIVLNAGTGYAALDKTAYVLHCVFKGDATAASSAVVNVARFETQSNGRVGDLLFVSANAGSTVEGDVARFVAHVAPTRAILAVQNGTAGSTPMGICVDIDETMTTGIQFNTGAALTNVFQITSTANTAYFLLVDAEAGCVPDYNAPGSAIANLKVKIGDTDGYIKIYDAP